jgi:hypothetical protein
MSIPVSFSERDLSRGTILTPGWYRMKIDSVTTKPSKDNTSTNYVVEGTVICNADDGSSDFANCVVTWNFNSKAPGFMQGLFKALLNTDKLVPGERYDLQAAEGKEVDVFVENGEYEGRIVNRVPHRYRYPKQG